LTFFSFPRLVFHKDFFRLKSLIFWSIFFGWPTFFLK